MAQFLKLNDLLTDDNYTVTDEEVKQAFLDHGLVPHTPQETEETMNNETLDSLEKIPVPQHVADWLDTPSHGLFGLNYDMVPSEIYDWVYATNDNLKKIHLAVVVGYTIEP